MNTRKVYNRKKSIEKNNKLKSENKLKLLKLIPAFLLLIPWTLIVHIETLRSKLENQPWYPNLEWNDDFFLWDRSWGLVGIGILMLAVLLITKYKDMKQNNNCCISFRQDWPLYIYGILAVCSSFLSPNRLFAIEGMTEQYETIWVLLTYLIIFFYFRIIFRDEKLRIWIFYFILIEAAIQTAIGLSQLIGRDFWSSPIGIKLITFGTQSDKNLEFIFSESGQGSVYLSFYHPNYAAVYLIIIIPLIVAAVRLAEKKWQKIVCTILVIGMLACLWGTGSKTGLFTLFVMIILAITKYVGEKRKLIIMLVCFLGSVMLYVFIGYFIPQDTMLEKTVKNAFPTKQEQMLTEVTTGKDVKIVYNGKELHLSVEEENGKAYFQIADKNGQTLPLDYDKDTKRFSLHGEKTSNLKFYAYREDGTCHLEMDLGEIPWYFQKGKDDETYDYITLYGKKDNILNAVHVFPDGWGSALSGRWYIWSRTIPLITKNILLGSGANTFALNFPQNDYVARTNISSEMLLTIISKAHSFYLQTIVQTGLLSMMVLIVFMISLLRRIRKTGCQGNYEIFLSIIGYLLMGLTNDSMVVTAPFFWAILGLGAGISFCKN
ncbi:MAG: O-antigen ligase family protein [Eubacteriales bacterium]|nr:O-antigen ligase family protein [Eubacteriales bacterium]